MTTVTMLARTLQEHGFRLTAARRIILEALVAHEGHLTADDLAARIQAEEPGIGRMTVYRTLDLLSELNVVRPIYQGTGAAHYVLLHDGHHHHLVCSSCDRVIDFDECALADVEQAVRARFGFVVEAHLVEFYGRCQECLDATQG